MEVYSNIVQIIISVALIAIILLQTKSSGIGGTETAIHKTRRGLERTLFNITIGLSVAFFIITILNVIITG